MQKSLKFDIFALLYHVNYCISSSISNLLNTNMRILKGNLTAGGMGFQQSLAVYAVRDKNTVEISATWREKDYNTHNALGELSTTSAGFMNDTLLLQSGHVRHISMTFSDNTRDPMLR